MSNETNLESANKVKSPPPNRAWCVRDYGDKSYWNEVMVGWPHKDGQGFDLNLHSLPIDGRLVVRVNKP